MKELGKLLAGLILSVIGLVSLFSKLRISSGIFSSGSSGLLLLLIIIAIVAMAVRCNWITVGLFVCSILVFVVYVIINSRVYMANMSALDTIITVSTLFSGICLTTCSLLGKKS